MQNVRPTDLAPAAEHVSPVSGAINRVIAIAPAPLLPGEKQADYADVAVGIVRAAQPRDAIEEFLVRDAIDLTWEIFAPPLHIRIAEGSMTPASGHREANKQSAGQAGKVGGRRQRGAPKSRLLNKAGLTIDEATAKTLQKKLDCFERLDRMLASAEARRNNALREIDRHRDALGGGVRRSIEEIEDAEFRDVETGKAAAGAES